MKKLQIDMSFKIAWRPYWNN